MKCPKCKKEMKFHKAKIKNVLTLGGLKEMHIPNEYRCISCREFIKKQEEKKNEF